MRVCTRCQGLLTLDALTCPADGAPAQEVETLPTGTLLGAYKIERVLGEGGMGFVYEATHEVLRRRAAIKLLRPELAPHAQIVTRFLQEAKAVNLIDHPNIINVYDFGEGADGSVYFVMEFLAGETLDDLMRRRKPLPVPLLLHTFGQIAKALVAAHAKQIVHRDLKPANVYVIAREGNPYFIKLLDFGIAQLRGEGAIKGLTTAGMVLGTPQYMSPEQIAGEPIDARTDVWALGVMLYRAATGHAPFQGDGFQQLAATILKDTPRSPRELVPGLPVQLDQLVMSCLERKVADRCQSVAEVIAGLERVKRELGLDDDRILAGVVTDAGTTPTTPPTAPAGEPARTRGSLAASLPQYQGADVLVRSPAVSAPVAAAPGTPGRSRATLVAAGGAALLMVAAAIYLGVGRGRPAQTTAEASAPSPVTAPPGVTPPAPVRPATPPVPGGSSQTIAVAFARGDTAEVRRLADAAVHAAIASGNLQEQGLAVDALAAVRTVSGAPHLYLALKGSPEVRVKAARALGELALPDAAPKVRAALAESGDKVKVELAAVLVRLGDQDARAILERAVDDPGMRLVAALALVDLGQGPRARPVLTDLFDSTPAGREPWRRAAGGLTKLGDARARAALEAELAQPDAARAVAAAALLVALGDAKAKAYLGRVATDAAFARRGEAALALARVGDAAGAGWVAGGLASADRAERVQAIATAASLHDPAHHPELAQLATDDPDRGVRLTAAAALIGP